jgi:hypothetical protein
LVTAKAFFIVVVDRINHGIASVQAENIVLIKLSTDGKPSIPVISSTCPAAPPTAGRSAEPAGCWRGRCR